MLTSRASQLSWHPGLQLFVAVSSTGNFNRVMTSP